MPDRSGFFPFFPSREPPRRAARMSAMTVPPQTDPHGAEATEAATPDDAIRAVVERLARPHRSGGLVIERAAILAKGADCTAVVAWITAHDGQPETALAAPAGGLHGARLSPTAAPRVPSRYVVPAEALATRAGYARGSR